MITLSGRASPGPRALVLSLRWEEGKARIAYTSVIEDSLDPDADLEDAPRDRPEETAANARDLIDSYVPTEIEEVEEGSSDP